MVRFARGEPDRAYTERLLDAPSAARGSRDPLARLLAAAAAPPRPHELAGEEAAVEAFRRARHAPARPAASPRRIRPLTAVAIACAGMVVTATAWIALAANGVRLGAGRPAPVSPAPAPSAAASTVPPVMPSAPAESTLAGPAEPTAPSDMVGLCHAYLNAGHGTNGQPLEIPAFRRLVEVAGGEDEVGPYCERVLAESGRRTPDQPTPSQRRGSGRGPPWGTPPGLGGDPPGHGGEPPGLGGKPPGHGGTPPGLGGDPPGRGGDPPGRGRGEGERP